MVNGHRTKTRDGFHVPPDSFHSLHFVRYTRCVGIDDQIILAYVWIAQQRLDRASGVVGAGVGEESDGGEHLIKFSLRQESVTCK